KKNGRCLLCKFEILLAVYQFRHLLGKCFLQNTQMWRLLMLSNQFFYFYHRPERENQYHFGSIFICHFEPELVKLVRRSFLRIKPYIAGFGFAKFATIGFGNEWAGKGESLSPAFSPDQFGTGHHIPPLIGTTHLKTYAHGLV